ncbi:MAG: single-stranded-DNA-specific exonuclease RecJ [Arenicellales bacterium]
MPYAVSKSIVRREVVGRLPKSDRTLHPLLRRIFLQRKINGLEDLDHSLAGLYQPDKLKDIDKAAALLYCAVEQGWRVLIVGDYDTDGATATAVAILGLRSLGATSVDYLVPNRFDYGYGLSVEIAKVALIKEPDLVITVDNGISSLAGVKCLREAGIEVIVTDHHLAGVELPAASAIVNPNQPGCEFPSKMLAGVGVMFYLLLALRSLLSAKDWFERNQRKVPNLAQLLDLVALGTVADVVPLDHNNRILVAQGIARIHKGACRLGIKALLAVAGKDYRNVSSTDLGFVLAPRLNAAGRLDDISMGIECLLADEETDAREYADILHEINIERRRIEQKMQHQAVEVVDKLEASKETAGICLHHADWHQGITGLVASRVRERYHQPAIVFANNSEGKLTGSARSVPGLHIRDLLEVIATGQPGLIEKFGGHAMAAGLTLDRDNLEPFSRLFHTAVSDHFLGQPAGNFVHSDGPLEPEFFTREIAELLRNAAPWGQQFSAPVFDNEFRVISQKVVGEQHLKLRLATRDRVLEGIAFRQLLPGEEMPRLERIHAAFQLDLNEFRGAKTLQLIIEYMEPVTNTVAR